MSRPSREFGGLIWTDHAIERLIDRKLPQHIAAQVFTSPDKIVTGKEQNTKEYQKRIGAFFVTLIVTPNDRNQKIVISAWINPPYAGTEKEKERWIEYKNAYARAGFWGKCWLVFKRQIGL
jgi:hypothetical protein